MEKLSVNHPRFCAKYVKHIGVAKETKVGWTRVFEMNGKFFIIRRDAEFKIGDKVWIAKKIPTPDQQWNVHEVILPEDYWTYSFHMSKDPKEQRKNTYNPRAKYWFGKQCYVIEEVSYDYIQKTFSFRKYNR